MLKPSLRAAGAIHFELPFKSTTEVQLLDRRLEEFKIADERGELS